MPYTNEYQQEIKNSTKYLHTGKETKYNATDLKIGDKVEFLGWTATTYRACRIVSISCFRWGVRYYLQGIKKDGTLGKYENTADALYTEYMRKNMEVA